MRKKQLFGGISASQSAGQIVQNQRQMMPRRSRRVKGKMMLGLAQASYAASPA
ncbi:hypothetical protein [Paenibacillus sp. FSL M7-0420]|uniref:hypothetical protein n=1 Tax=Paenibacillus sp. FSL M7-0420 TaxID=2921609 RepID=UPI0030FCE37B